MRLLNKIWTRDKRRKAVAIAMTIILCLAFVNHRVDAYYLLGYKYINGISNLIWSYYNPSSLMPNCGNYLSGMYTSTAAWENGVSSLDFTYSSYSTSNNVIYNIVFLVGNYGSGGSYGGAIYYNSSGNLVSTYNSNTGTYNGPTQNYAYVFIRCNHSLMQSFTANNRLVAMYSHEIGHALGLAHADYNPYVVMYKYNVDDYYTYYIYLPQTDDCLGVTNLYSN